MSTAEQKLREAKLPDELGEDAIAQLAALMDQHARETSRERTNLLRLVMEDTAERLKAGGSVAEVAQQLEDASSASFDELCELNVEIEMDEDLGQTRSRPQIHGDPILIALYRAMQLRDGIAALEISGEVPTPQRHAEYLEALQALKHALNTHLKDKD